MASRGKAPRLNALMDRSVKEMTLNEYYNRFVPLHDSKDFHLRQKQQMMIAQRKRDREQQLLLKQHQARMKQNLQAPKRNEAGLVVMIFALFMGALLLNHVFGFTHAEAFNIDKSVRMIEYYGYEAGSTVLYGFAQFTSSIASITGFVVLDNAPDLTIVSIAPNVSYSVQGDTYLLSNLTQNETISFNVTIKNNGSVAFNATTLLFNWSYGDGNGSQDLKLVPSISAGQNTSLAIGSHSYGIGNHTLNITLDVNDVVDEMDESNNYKNITVRIDGFLDAEVVQTFPALENTTYTFAYTENQNLTEYAIMKCLYQDCGNVNLTFTERNASGELPANLSSSTYTIINHTPLVWSNAKKDESHVFNATIHPVGGVGTMFSIRYKLTWNNEEWYVPYFLNFTIVQSDYTPPVMALLQPANNSIIAGDNTSFTVGMSTDENASCRISQNASFNFSNGTLMSSTTKRTHTTLLQSLNASTSYSYYFKCQDVWNNTNNDSLKLSFSLNSSDVTPPSISFITPTNDSLLANGTTKVTVRAQTNEAATCYLTDNNNYIGPVMVKENSTVHTADITGLQDNTTYRRWISCVDTAGNSASYRYLVFTVGAPDTSSPDIDSSVTVSIRRDKYESLLVATVYTDEPAKCNFDTSDISFNSMKNITTSYVNSHRFRTAFTANTTATFYVKCIDESGNIGAAKKIEEAVSLDPQSIDDYDFQNVVAGSAATVWQYIKSDGSATFETGKDSIQLTSVNFSVSTENKDVLMMVRSYNTLPQGIGTPPYTPFQFYRIVTENVHEARDITLKFRIPLSVLPANESFIIGKYSGTQWYALPSTVLSKDSTYLYAAATASELDGIYGVAYPSVACVSSWQCSAWEDCLLGEQIRGCEDLNHCDALNVSYIERKECNTVIPAPVQPTCNDSIQNENEEGIDCGGVCTTVCTSCSDGIQNGLEEGIDCGVGCNQECATCDDGIQNGLEEGVDCGGNCIACEAEVVLEEPAPVEEKSSVLKWVIIAIILMMIGGISILGLRYYQINEHETIDEQLIEYLTTELYQSVDKETLKSTLLAEGWDEQMIDEYLKVVSFILSKIELNPEIDSVIDELFQSGWNLKEARVFAKKVTLFYLIEEIKRHKELPLNKVHGLLMNEGFSQELVDTAIGEYSRK